MRAVKALMAVGAVLGALATLWWVLEMVLLKISRYRLSHGDGREHSFRRKARPGV